jgi:selenide,water dikinase
VAKVLRMKDLEKRRRVMQRSMRLGHCICDPKKACPCDTLREKDICPCAGERLDGGSAPLRLTELVDSPGCASKIDEASLKKVLAGLPPVTDPRVLIGMPAGDDAGVFRLNGDVALVQTVDVFSPSVDDPYVFGQIAAANSVSDVYAMGGRPVTALSIVGFPIRSAPEDVMHQILRGGIDKMGEAGVAVVGGHSINDKEIKAGFAVTGLIDPEKIVSNAGARPGDRLILTKPLGLGVMAFAGQIGRAPTGGPEAAARCMASLNRRASELMVEFGAHASTDVTGFGLMGHLANLASASRVDIEVVWDDVPLLPGVLQCAADGIFPGAVERNRESSGHYVTADEGIEPAMLDLFFDPQTSGGLLIAVSRSSADGLLRRLHEEGVSEAAVIGEVLAAGSGRVRIRNEGRRPLPAPRQVSRVSAAVAARQPDVAACCPEVETGGMSCCEEDRGSGGVTVGEASVVSSLRTRFQDFLKSAGAPGALDAYTKQAVAIALSVLAKCEPCAKIHISKARQKGFSQEEIDEAAWMAISFGGSPTMLFYNGLKDL